MTKKEFLQALKQELVNHQVTNYVDAINKYEARFKLAEEAGFSEEEAASKFGDPKEIAMKYINKALDSSTKKETASKDTSTTQEGPHITSGKPYTIVLSLVADDIKLEYGDVAEPYVNFNDANPDDYLIKKDSDQSFFRLEFVPKMKFFSKMHRSHITLTLPKDISLGSLSINSVSSKVILGDVIADDLRLSTVSGNIIIDSIRSKYLSFSMVSGNVKAKSIVGETVKLNTVSGSLNASYGEIDNMSVNGVSGNVIFDGGKVHNVKSSILSGKVVVGGESIK